MKIIVGGIVYEYGKSLLQEIEEAIEELGLAYEGQYICLSCYPGK